MKISTFRDWTLSIAAIVFIFLSLAFTIYGAISIHRMNQLLQETTNLTEEIVFSDVFGSNVFETIQCYKSEAGDKYIAEITLQNMGSEEIGPLTCEVYDSATLISNQKIKTIPALSPNSQELCMFEFTGTSNRTLVRFKFSYDNSSYTRFCIMH